VTETAVAVEVALVVVDDVVVVVVVLPEPERAPVWMASALYGLTVAVKLPPETVIEVPAQTPEVGTPGMTSQYTPLGREVVNVFVHDELPLLMMTNPTEPLPKAICDDEPLTQLVNVVPLATLKNETMPVNATHLC